MKGKDFMLFGAFLGALAVAIGAFGAHWLKDLMDEKELANFKTASNYHFYHAIMLVFVGYYSNRKQKSLSLIISGYSFLVGILLFCFSLYGYAIFNGTWMAIITPVGGLAFIIGWGALAFEVVKSKI
ncbi:MAG: DUF423 domain-containing protein [Bacteroidia bacterium]